MLHLEFNDGAYTKLRKELIRNKGSELQKELLEVAKDDESFIQWIERRVNSESEGKEFDLWTDQLSKAEYKLPPGNVEKQLFKRWERLTPAQASRETFWGYVTLEHIKRGVIESSYLAANDKPSLSGLERINEALNTGKEVSIDDVVRTILRNLSGLPEARGYKSVYVNCPFARAWWRVFIAHQVCDETDADFNKIFTTLRGSSTGFWEEFITLIVGRNSVMGDTKVRSALIWALSEREEVKTAKTLAKITKQIGIRSALRELGVLEIKDLKEQIVEPTISRVLENEQKAKERKTQDKAEAKHNETQEPKPKSKPKRSKRFWRRS